MPNTSGAKKALRSSARKSVFNLRRKRAMHDAVKSVRDFVAAKDTVSADKALPTAYKAIDKAAKRGVIKENTAGRKKSRLSNLVKKAKHSSK